MTSQHRPANAREWSIQELSRLAGTTSRSLRHYHAEGLLHPVRVGQNGQRYYDQASLLRLQRILLLRGLGLGIRAIRDVLTGTRDDEEALRRHLAWLRQEQDRLARQIASVERTIRAIERGEPLMPSTMFEGFDHTKYKDEVEERWGKDAYARGDSWWRGLSNDEKQASQERTASLIADWARAAAAGVEPSSEEAQALARRQFEWLASIPGTPKDGHGPSKEYFIGLGEMYAADERFAANYGGTKGAEFVRDAMHEFAERNL